MPQDYSPVELPRVARVHHCRSPFLTRSGEQVAQVQLRVSGLFDRPSAILTLDGDDYVATRVGCPIERQATWLEAEFTLPQLEDATPATLHLEGAPGSPCRDIGITVPPVRHWTIFVVPNIHTDIGYTDLQEATIRVHVENLIRAAKVAEENPDFTFVVETAQQVQYLLEQADPTDRDRVLEGLRSGRFFLGAAHDDILTGLCSHEEICRLLLLAGNLNRQYQIPFDTAIINDVPSLIGTFPMILAGAGVKYLIHGINATRSHRAAWRRSHSPFYWEGPDGSRVLAWFSQGYGQASRFLRLHMGVREARAVIPDFLDQFVDADYPFDELLVNGLYGDNVALDQKLVETVRAWNAEFVWPRVVVEAPGTFFRQVEAQHGAELRVFKVDFGTFWEDGAGSSAAETAANRAAHRAIATAESLFSFLAALGSPEPYPRRELDRAWFDTMMYDEHTWGAHTSITAPTSDFTRQQWEYKRRFALRAQETGQALATQALARLGARVRTPTEALLVYNPHGSTNRGAVSVRLPEGMCPIDSATGRAIPVAPARDGSGAAVCLVPDIPGLGYRTFPLTTNPEPLADRTAIPVERFPVVVSSPFYTVTIEGSGRIASIIDRVLNRELVDPDSPYGWGDYLYVTGGEESRMIDERYKAEPRLQVHRLQPPLRISTRSTPLGEEVLIQGTTFRSPVVEFWLFLPGDDKRIELELTLEKQLTYTKEGVYVAFPFQLESPTAEVEVAGGFVRPGQDQSPDGCHDWFAAQNWISLASPDWSVLWSSPDAPLVTFGDVWRGNWREASSLGRGHLFSWVMNNYWHTNYLAGQGGHFRFRYLITSGQSFSSVEKFQFGERAAQSLQACIIPAHPTGGLPNTDRFLWVEGNEVRVIAIKQAEDGRGIIVRLLNGSEQDSVVTLRPQLLRFSAAWACDLVERDQETLDVVQNAVRVPVRARGIATTRLL